MASINMPSNRGTAIDRLASGLGIANAILGIKGSIDKNAQDEKEREKAARFDQGDSAESASFREGYKALGLSVGDADSANSLERRYGKLAELNQEKFKTGLKATTPDYALTQKDIAGFVTQGARLVPPGTKGAQTFSAVGADGKVALVALMPPKEKSQDSGAAGKQLPSDKVLLVNQGNQMPKLLSNIRSTISNNMDAFGPFAGRFGGANPYNRQAQAIQSQMKTAAQMVGKFMEDGVLRKEDEVKYEAMLPGLADTPESAADKLAIVENMLAEKQQSNIEALRVSGYDVSGVDSRLSVPQLPGVLAGQGRNGSDFIPDAQAGDGKTNFSNEDIAAYEEAQIRLKANPQDTVARKALDMLRGKGLR